MIRFLVQGVLAVRRSPIQVSREQGWVLQTCSKYLAESPDSAPAQVLVTYCSARTVEANTL